MLRSVIFFIPFIFYINFSHADTCKSEFSSFDYEIEKIDSKTDNLIEKYKQEIEDIYLKAEQIDQSAFKEYISEIDLHSKEILTNVHNNKDLYQFIGTTQDQTNLNGINLYVFVSFSLDQKNLVKIAKETAVNGGKLVIRGLINNSFKETAIAVKELIEQAGIGVEINPELFSKYDIKAVPTFILVDEENCSKEMSCRNFDKISGNITLDYFFKKVKEQGELKEKLL
ncbi:MAG: type-F conjugative transfer system pilin assembly protein TrbC [Sphingobacteriia bacterium]|nr:type-F conjugative transfer system pilin assembly protein TrbC [Sphingobacteriia bacterium]